MNSYMSGSLVRTVANFTNSSGVLTDPSAVTFTFKTGASSSTTPSSVRDSAGVYHYDIDTSGWTGPGSLLYVLEWIGTGTVQAITSDSFAVIAPAI